MTLDQLIHKADAAYSDGDGLVQSYHDDRDGEHGDTLAKFVAIELAETFDADATEEDQIAEVRRVLQSAIDELLSVLDAF